VTASQSKPNGKDGRTSQASEARRSISGPVLAGLLAIGLTGLALWRWGGPLFAFFRDKTQVREWLAGFGPLAPLISIGLNTAQVLLAPVPGQVIGLANGYLFGVLWGTVYSLLGVSLGSALAMGLGRWLGRPIVERFVGSAHLARWDHLVDRRGPPFFFLVFLLPLVPDDIACFAVGLSPLSIPYILALAVIGRLPGLIVSSWIGANASSLSPAGWALVAAGTLALAGIVLLYRDRVEAWLLQMAERWSERI
jgi:uncharacterized membrane protein YdjX (TVP38/TMEM64 family)